jgi:hypothetical protein
MKLIILFPLIFLLYGCGASEATTYNRNKQCKSVVEGFYESNIRFSRKCPVLVFKKLHSPRLLYGKIVSVSDTGVIFDPNRESPFYDLDAAFYSKEEIDCVVDSQGFSVFGNIPDKFQLICNMEWEIENTQDKSNKTSKLLFYSGNKFAYCLDAGTYRVKKVLFTADLDYGYTWEDELIANYEIKFSVENNKTNYIGNMLLDYPVEDSTNVHQLLCKIEHRPDKEQKTRAIGYSLMFAPILALPLSLVSLFSSSDNFMIHHLQILHDPNYISNVSLPITTTFPSIELRTSLIH